MQIIINSVSSPKWADADQTMIDVLVDFEHIDGEVWFTASPNDTTSYGPDIYEKAIAGEFGPIGEYQAPEEV